MINGKSKRNMLIESCKTKFANHINSYGVEITTKAVNTSFTVKIVFEAKNLDQKTKRLNLTLHY